VHFSCRQAEAAEQKAQEEVAAAEAKKLAEQAAAAAKVRVPTAWPVCAPLSP
jgi:hypothetical protein